MGYEGDLHSLMDFIDESKESLQEIECDFIALEQDPGDPEIINRIFRPVHSLKGNSSFFELTGINKLAHRLENLLDFLRNGKMLANKEIINILLRGVEQLQQLLNRVETNPKNTHLLPEDEDFLAEVESYQPQTEEVSVQSIAIFENLLEEFLALGMNIRDYSTISSLFEQIAKVNRTIENLINDQKKSVSTIFSSEYSYWLRGKDCTESLRIFGIVADNLTQNKPISREMLTAFSQAIEQVAAIKTDLRESSCPLEELRIMKNFLDDELMMANSEYTNSMQEAVNKVISCFECREPESSQRQVLGEILIKQQLVSKEQVTAAVQQQKKIGEILVDQGALTEKTLNHALHKQDQQTMNEHLGKRKLPEISKSIRIDQGRLDQFADAVGGLYISLDSVHYLKRQLEAAQVSHDLLERFDNTANGFDEKLKKLHAGIMDIRRIPVKPLFQRFPKVIRQLATSLNKDIFFSVSGEDTVVDKDLLEKIENPLVHILRNSVDHGLEGPEERAEVNKARQGSLQLSAAVDENNLYLIVVDDGKGIDPQKMREIAVKKGFALESEISEYTDKELVNLIFKPGFSSAEKVSDVSGRGVGMDVVLSALKQCNGLIELDSKLGKGTTVSITIPLTKTLITKDALLVKAGNENFFIPSEMMTTVLETRKIVTMMSSEKCFDYDNKALRLIDLNNFFPGQVGDNSLHNSKKIVVCADYNIGLAVDKVLSHQKIVVKEFDQNVWEIAQTIKGISGYTIMGNDEIVLIVDVGYFVN